MIAGYDSRFIDIKMSTIKIQLLFVLAICIPVIAQSVTILKYENGRKTWKSALDTCIANYNATLWNNDRVSENLTQTISVYLRDDDKIWTGLYTILTSWISDEGCFVVDKSTFTRVISDSKPQTIGDCFLECDKLSLTYFAIKGYACYCSSILPYNAVDSNKCLPTSKFYTEASLLRFYRHFSPSADDKLKFTRCATASCKGTDPVVYRAAQNCSRKFPAVCSNGTIITDPVSHATAEAACANIDSKLVGAIGDNLCDVFDTSGEGQRYWIGLYRHDAGPYSSNKDTNTKYLYECQSSTLHDSVLHSTMENCYVRLHPFFCQLEPNSFLIDTLCLDSTMSESKFIYEEENEVLNLNLSQLCTRLHTLYPSNQVFKADLYESGLIGIIVCAALIACWCLIVLVICSRKGRKRRKIPREKPEVKNEEESVKFVHRYETDSEGSRIQIHS